MYRATLDTCNIRPELWVREHEEYLRHRPLLGGRVSLESQRQSDLDRGAEDVGGSERDSDGRYRNFWNDTGLAVLI